MRTTQNNTKPMRPRIGVGFAGCSRLEWRGSAGSVLSAAERGDSA